MAQEQINDAMLYLSVRELGQRICERRLSPVALTEGYLDRLQKHGERLGAVVTIMRESALAEARTAERAIRDGNYRGPLHGIPYGAKDLLATRGVPTTWGAEPYRKQVFDYDASVVRKLRAAGAVLVAKLAMVELAGGFGYNNADASFTGPGRCPWNLDYWSGGSSSGPGSAVAAALVPFALGSETSGSIITPAAFCGVSGLRPTYGRVSRHGAMALSWTLDKLGPMCRTAEDCGLVLAAMAGYDAADATTSRRQFAYPLTPGPSTPKGEGRGAKKRYRLGIFANSLNGAQAEVRRNFEQSLEVLRRFCDVVEDVPFPDLPFSAAVGTIIDAEGASAFRELLETGQARQLRAGNDRWGGYDGMTVLAVDYLQAMRVRPQMKRALDEVYARFDAIVGPSRSTVSYPIATDFDKAYPNLGNGPPIIPAGNIVGQPALSIPNGFGINNLPTGIQFTGRVWSEAKLLSIAQAYQQQTDWHTRRPRL